MPLFSASSSIDTYTPNKTKIVFSQPVSGDVLDTALKATKIPYQIDYLYRNQRSNEYRVTRYTDPTKKTLIDLGSIVSIYGDTLPSKKFTITIAPYSLDEYQKYVSIV